MKRGSDAVERNLSCNMLFFSLSCFENNLALIEILGNSNELLKSLIDYLCFSVSNNLSPQLYTMFHYFKAALSFSLVFDLKH